MIVHELKTWPTYFRPVWDGEKTFEIRFDDRGFQCGDVVDLREFDRGRPCACADRFHIGECAKYTGRRVLATIGYVLASTPPRGQQRGFEGRGYVVFSLVDVERFEDMPGRLTGDAVASVPTSVPTPAMFATVPAQRRPPGT